MSKFCTNCGKELKDGRCDCVKVKENNQVSNFCNKYIEILKSIFLKPVDTIKENSNEDNFLFGLISLCIVSILSGLFTYLILSEGVSKLSTGFMFSMRSMYKVPFLKTFISGFLVSVIWYAVLAFIIYLIANKLFKDKLTVKETIAFIGVLSVFMAPVVLASILLIFVSMKLMLLVLVIASMFYMVYFIQGLMEITKIDKNKIACLYVPALLLTFFIVYYVLPKLLSL
ncbi:MAG: YIP1 family protein [Bacilli bacterium]|nr:YIP1 family protein [Bacilli bacterium]